MKKSVVILSALFALVSLSMVSGAEEETESSTEVPVQKVHVLNPGEKEYLSPNLIGLQNIAVTNIPVSINFVNIIDAFREVVDGVKYEIVLNAVNTTDNNAEIVCRIVVLEKPWLTTLWGDKVRLLKESNCTSEELLDNTRDRKSIEEKYETNAIFTGNRNELTADDMNKLESQILDSPKNPQLRRQPSLSSPTITTTTTESIVSDDVPKPVNTQTEGEQGVVSVSAAIEDDVVQSSTEPSITTTTTTTTEKLPELSNDEKKWLDDFLSIGAYNFEVSQQKTPENQNNEEQLNDQESAKRFARQIVGGPRQLNADELKTEQENLAKSLSKIAAGVGPSYTIDKVYSGTTQVVAGSLVKLDADLIEGQTGEKNRCIVSLWSQPWLKQDGYEVTFECKDKPKSVHRHSRSANERPLAGGVRQLNEEELKSEQENLAKSLSKIAAGVGPSYTIDKVYSGTIQVVSGHLVKLDADLIEGQTGEKNRCIVSLWSQPWLKQNGYEVTLECKDKPKIVQRHSRSVEN